jgi:hypothetical protein
LFCKPRNNQAGETSGYKSGGLVSVLASGASTCPKNARDLTVIITAKHTYTWSKRGRERERRSLNLNFKIQN